MNALPFITCLCPTYRRPELLRSAIACFQAQDYPAERRELLIVDDAGQIDAQFGYRWAILSVRERFESLPAKYNRMAEVADKRAEAFCIWEDDDLYLSHHLSAHAAALSRSRWSKPSKVLSLYTGEPMQEAADGRFFASLAVRKDLWNEIGGVTNSPRADFDQQFIAALGRAGGPPADPLHDSPDRIPGYCFRWGSTAAYHGQHQMRSPDDTTWYQRCAKTDVVPRVGRIFPELPRDWSLLPRS